MKPKFRATSFLPSSLIVMQMGVCIGWSALQANGQTTFEWTGGATGTGVNLFGSGGYGNWTPTLTAPDIATGTVNVFNIATRTGGGGGVFLGNGEAFLSVSASPIIGRLTFDDTSGHFPPDLMVRSNSATGTTIRTITFEQPDTTIISLESNVTGIVRIGNTVSPGSPTHGNLSLRLPNSGASTINVANAAATLDLGGLASNTSGQGGINAGILATQSLDHARLRKTGAGTLSLKSVDGQGHRVLGLTVEGGKVILGKNEEFGWAPTAVMADHVVLNGGTLELDGFTTNSGSNRGFQIGNAGGTIRMLSTAHALLGVVADIPGQSGKLTKTGPTQLRLANTNTYTGGTVIEEGTLRYSAIGSFGSGSVTIKNGAVLSPFAGSVVLPNEIIIDGAEAGFGGDGFFVYLSGSVDLGNQTRTFIINNSTEIQGDITEGSITLRASTNSQNLIIASAPSYSGETTVDRGGFIVNGSISGDVNVTRGVFAPTAVGSLGGTGFVGGNVVCSGEVRPGPTSTVDPPAPLEINGNLSMQAGSLMVFDLAGATSFDTLSIGGNATLDGRATVQFAPGYVPDIDQVFTLVNVTGSLSLGSNFLFELPSPGPGRLWDTSEFATTGSIKIVAGTVAQNPYSWTGGYPGTTASLFSPASFALWDPALIIEDLELGSANTFNFGTTPGGSAIDTNFLFTLDQSVRLGALNFTDAGELFPSVLRFGANLADPTPRTLSFEIPDNTAISLGPDVTGTVAFGHDSTTYGPLGFLLPSSGTTTFHIENPTATLDLTGLLNTDVSRGGISAGATIQTTAHARLRKTGSGTLNLATQDTDGNRFLGLTSEGGTLIAGKISDLGMAPLTTTADSFILSDTKIVLQLASAATFASSRGFQIGGDGVTFDVPTFASGILGTVADIPGQSGKFIKTGAEAFRMGVDNTYSGGTDILQGRIRYTTENCMGSGPITMADGTGISAWTAGITLPNNISITGPTVFFGGDNNNISYFSGTVDLEGQTRTFRLLNSTSFSGELVNGGLALQCDLNSQRLELNGSCSFTGQTTVDRGRLVVSGSIPGSVNVLRGVSDPVAIGGLGGIGSVGGNVSVAGELQPGPVTTNVTGQLSVDGNLTLQNTANSVFQLLDAATYDSVGVGGSATLSGTITVSLLQGYAPVLGDSFNLVTATAGITGSELTFVLPTLADPLLAWDTSTFATTGTISVVVAATDPYDTWATANLLTGPNAGRNFDFEGDGFTNLQEYLFGGNPRVATAALSEVSTAGPSLILTYLELSSGGTYTIQSNDDLSGSWVPAANFTPVVPPVGQSGVPAGYVRKQFAIPITTRDFFRVEGVEN